MDKNKQFSGRKERFDETDSEFLATSAVKRSNSVAFFASLHLCVKQKSTNLNHGFISDDMI